MVLQLRPVRLDGVIVGRVWLRGALDELLAREGGHIGSCVLPDHRRRGSATEMRSWISP